MSNMNKRIKALLVLTVIAIAFSACAKTDIYGIPPKMAAYEIVAAVDSNDGGLHADECTEWSTDKCSAFVSQSATNNKTVEFNGKTYIGEYWYSVVELFNTYQTDYYTFDDGWFAVNQSDNSLSSIIFYDIKTGSKTVDDCEEEALRLAKQYIDVDHYELTTQSDEYINTYIFQRYIDGCKTCANLSIGFSTNGDVVTFSVMMTDEIEANLNQRGIISAKSTVERLGSDNGKMVLENKIKSIYPNLNEYEIVEKIIVILDDGSVGMVYIADVTYTLSETESEENVGSSRICILVRENE